MLLDAHVHTDMYSETLFKEVAEQCNTNNIKLLSVSMCIPSYEKILRLSKKYEFIIPSFGIHPWKAKKYSNKLAELDIYLEQAKYIGEIGLDKKFLKYADPYIDQLQVFEYIISHDNVKNKFLNLHTSDAEVEVVKFLEQYKHNKFIVHWYEGDLSVIDRYLSLGGYFSIGVEILFSSHIKEIAKVIPLDKILVETDNPSSYSWLKGHESYDGLPDLLYKVIDEICKVKDISKSDFLAQLSLNQNMVV